MGSGCVLYLKWKNEDESAVDIKFLCAKGKVGPITGNTVPRNELCGALLLSRLACSTFSAFQHTEINKMLVTNQPRLCVDSTTVLSWVQSPAINYKPFVKNKILEIQNLTPSGHWRYVPSQKNKAADLLSKGCRKDDLRIILEGPELLHVPEENWPKILDKKMEVDKEEGTVHMVQSTAVAKTFVDPHQYSKWSKLVRITWYVLRFLKLCKKVREENEQHGEILCNMDKDGVSEAENYWFRWAQHSLPTHKAELRKLVPFTDKSGVKRATGRLRELNLFGYDRRHPVILPGDNIISRLILQEIHEKLFHPGHSRVLAESRMRFWIINGRRIAKSIGYRCIICRRWRGKQLSQIMSDLPAFRIESGVAPFQNSSVDYFGPFLVKYGRRQRIKAYGVVFTCLVTRALHLDVALSLTTESFLMAFRRFMAVYGQPTYIRSDNGRNFRGSATIIKEMLKKLRVDEGERNKLTSFTASANIKWTFSTPLASHHNGAVESLIKSVKSSLNKVVKDRVLSEEEYRTILSEVQASINSRPLWPPTEGDIEDPPITCNDLLRPRGLLRDSEALNKTNLRIRYGFIQKLVDEWWKCWMRNFAPNLQQRSIWYKPRENVSIGDVVLIIDRDIQRSKWQMAIVSEVYVRGDGKVRSVKLKTSSGYYIRPITKLCMLLSKNEYL